METQSLLAEKILQQAELEERTPKKVLVLDLDNTLWGGLAGETDHTPVLYRKTTAVWLIKICNRS